MYLALSSAWLAIVAWLIVRAFNQRRLLEVLAPAPPPGESAPSIVVVVPVRDEEANVADCIGGLLAQDYPAARLNVLVVDDHSRDATARIVDDLAARTGGLSCRRSPPLPTRWLGKSHACWIGARSVPEDTEWLCFLDADVRVERGLLAGAIHAATAEHIDLLSLAPRQELKSFAERLVIPCGLCLLAFRQDLATLQAREGQGVTATGQFMLVRRSAYEASGGHAAVCAAVCEDTALAALLKRRGAHVVLRDGKRLLSVCMYTGWRPLWLGLTKNIVDMLGGPAATVLTAAVGVALAWASVLLPLLAARSCATAGGAACAALAPALVASGAILALHIAGAAYFHIPFWYGFLFPLGYTAGGMMALDSVRRRWTGAVSWKGRTYPR